VKAIGGTDPDPVALPDPVMFLRPTYPVRTARLRLRPFVVDDVEAMLAYRGRADVCRYLPFEPQDRATLLDRLSGPVLSRSDLTGEDQALTLGVWRHDTGQLVGDVILFLRSESNRGGEIGWVFDPEHGGQGFATEAAGAVLDLAFADLGLHRVEARLDARNERSAALCERLGMRQEAHFRDTAVSDGGWADLLVYGLLAREWSGTAR
jgi:RimJ/RimL family protein N-acetyltransferase